MFILYLYQSNDFTLKKKYPLMPLRPNIYIFYAPTIPMNRNMFVCAPRDMCKNAHNIITYNS